MTPSPFQSSADAPDGPFGPRKEARDAIKSESDMTTPTPEIEAVEKVESLIAGEPAKAITKVERYLNARDFMGVESPFIDDQETGSSDGDPVVDLWAGDLRTILASHATLEARATAQAESINDLVESLTCILPMAKGYAAANRVGRNAEMIAEAEAALSKALPDPGEQSQ